MSTLDQAKLKEVSDKLSSIADFCSVFAGSGEKAHHDQILVINDPFKRETLLNKLPQKIRDPARTLITRFEESLQRILNTTDLDARENLIYKYRVMLEDVLKQAAYRSKKSPTPGSNLQDYGYSIQPFTVDQTAISITDSATPEVDQGSNHNHTKVKVTSKRRTAIPKETKDFLDEIFKTKRTPNSKERKAIAEKCGLTPLQVRVWFTNKRMRSK